MGPIPDCFLETIHPPEVQQEAIKGMHDTYMGN